MIAVFFLGYTKPSKAYQYRVPRRIIDPSPKYYKLFAFVSCASNLSRVFCLRLIRWFPGSFPILLRVFKTLPVPQGGQQVIDLSWWLTLRRRATVTFICNVRYQSCMGTIVWDWFWRLIRSGISAGTTDDSAGLVTQGWGMDRESPTHQLGSLGFHICTMRGAQSPPRLL